MPTEVFPAIFPEGETVLVLPSGVVSSSAQPRALRIGAQT